MIDAKYFKTEIVRIRAQYLHPQLVAIVEDMLSWLIKAGVNHPMITETATTPLEDKLKQRVSRTHSEGRAIDLRTRDWPPAVIGKFQAYFDAKYGYMGALSPKDFIPNLLIHHNTGLGDHFHIQVSTKFKMVMPNVLEPSGEKMDEILNLAKNMGIKKEGAS